MLFTSEQVSCGHPDKICDQISDAVVTDCLRHDRNSRVAVECLIKDYDIIIAGEITSAHQPDYKALVKRVLYRIGLGADCDKYKISTHITQQSKDIALGVDHDGAGDQGMMYGYATDETREMLPLPYVLATEALDRLRNLQSPILLPDAKCQVTYDYKCKRIDTFLISTQHQANVSLEDVKHLVEGVMRDTANAHELNLDFTALVNPTGRFVIGSSFADTGVTGRKIIADTYGGACRHGGGAFSGKDPSKVDRSAAYMARKIAKDIIRHRFARRCEIQVAYAIGMEDPVSIAVECFGTNRISEKKIVKWIKGNYDLTPAGIISVLGLKDVDYNDVSSGGHFTRQWMPWEK